MNINRSINPALANAVTAERYIPTPEEADLMICREVDLLTRENHQIWSSPDHDRSQYVHSFFQYPAMMVPIVQKRIIEIIVNAKGDVTNLLDSFMGSGTSLVAGMQMGLDCYGQDINPLAVLVSKTRTGPFYFKAIEERQQTLFTQIEQDNDITIEANFKGLYKWFTPVVAAELSRIVRAIRAEKNQTIRRFYWVILAETIRLTSNDRTSTFKLHARPLTEIATRVVSAIDIFKKHFVNSLEDLREHALQLEEANRLIKGAYTRQINLNLLNSKEKIATADDKEGFFDLHVTSPPYGDNKTTVTYGQFSYLPLQWIDLQDIDDRANETFLSTTSQIDSFGLGGTIRRFTTEELQALFGTSPRFEEIYQQIHRIDPKRARKVAAFFYDIYQTIQNIHIAMKVNGYQVWTVGNRTVAGINIPNNVIITDLIRSQGSILIKTINREILNRRMAARNSQANLMTFEDILIFRKIG
jgi:DNA modification methylase